MNLSPSTVKLLGAYSEIEPALQAGSYQSYRAALRAVLAELGKRFGRAAVSSELLLESLPSWKPFADTVPALKTLRQRFRLAIISKIDDHLFAETARALKVPFETVVRAQQVRSYKPSQRKRITRR